jgi:hypothetical protein
LEFETFCSTGKCPFCPAVPQPDMLLVSRRVRRILLRSLRHFKLPYSLPLILSNLRLRQPHLAPLHDCTRILLNLFLTHIIINTFVPSALASNNTGWLLHYCEYGPIKRGDALSHVRINIAATCNYSLETLDSSGRAIA